MKTTRADRKSISQGFTRRALPPPTDKTAIALSAKHLNHTIEYNKTHAADHMKDIDRAKAQLAKLKKHAAKGRTK